MKHQKHCALDLILWSTALSQSGLVPLVRNSSLSISIRPPRFMKKPRSELLNRPQFLLLQDTSMSSMASALFARAARPVSCTACRTVACPSVLGSAANFTSSQRGYSTSTEPTSDVQKPRWSYTPPRAKAPFSLRYNSKRAAFPVNEDPKRLDQFYIRMLGEDGDKMLSEEVKWLAVTHKSFDQGRRGFNDRLAFVGKRIVHLQTSLALVQNPANSGGPGVEDPFGRQPFAHPALEGLENLNNSTKLLVTSKLNLSQLAQKYQLDKVLRWSPRKPLSLTNSGIDLVLAHSLYAIVGAIALERGGDVANKVAQNRILEPLGVRTIA